MIDRSIDRYINRQINNIRFKVKEYLPNTWRALPCCVLPKKKIKQYKKFADIIILPIQKKKQKNIKISKDSI